jgi:hypothetical protein
MKVLAWLTILTAACLIGVVWAASFSDGNLDKSDTVPLILFTSAHGIAILFAVCYLWTTRKQLKEDRARELDEHNYTLPSSEKPNLKGVLEKRRSIFRLIALAAFFPGLLWCLLIWSIGGPFISGIIGLTIALIGYITLRLVDEEKRWKGTVLRATKWSFGKIRTWPLWIQGGLLSLVLTVTMFFVGMIGVGLISDYFLLITAATIAPAVPILRIPSENIPFGFIIFALPIGFWFLIGILLGKVTESFRKRYWVIIVAWLAIYTILSIAMKVSPYIEMSNTGQPFTR